MPPKIGSTVYGLDGTTHRLAQEIGKGGQGSVWSLDGEPSLVAKFYHNGFGPQDFRKLEAMCRLKTESLTSVAAWPLTLLKETKTGSPQGLLMKRIVGYQSVNQLYGLKSRLRVFPEAQLPFVLHVATNTARAFATIHDAGQVIGDVNHSNLLVSQNATVAMIDCDSFQVTDGSDIFVCPVGVPEFTPPELQGVSFSTRHRTSQHDAFGLSVLVFYLLFLGRHPFMGMFDPKADEILTLDRAISQYAFPYALSAQAPEVRLPGFAPRLETYPANIGDLFKRAFTRESLSRGRPTAHEWVGSLTSLVSLVAQCTVNANHHFPKGLNDCPWCRVEGAIGTPVFGFKIKTLRDETFSLVAIWAQIEAVRPSPGPLSKPDLDSLQSQYQVHKDIPEIIRKRRMFRAGSIGLVLLLSIIAVVQLQPFAAFLTIFAALITGVNLWNRGARLAKSFADTYVEATATYKRAESALDESISVPAVFSQEKQRIAKAKADYEALGPEREKRLAALDANRERKQRQHFLERFRIEDSTIAGIGPKNKLILRTWGIEDAWDIENARLQIKGFGPVKREALLEWRREKEQQFRFDPRQPVDPRDILALEQEFLQKSVALKSALNSGPQALRQTIAIWQSRRKQLLGALDSAANRLADAQVNRNALRGL